MSRAYRHFQNQKNIQRSMAEDSPGYRTFRLLQRSSENA